MAFTLLVNTLSSSNQIKSSGSGKYCIFTFPDKEAAVGASNALEGKGLLFTLTARPEDIMQPAGSNIALACRSNDQQTIGGILGEHGVQITGTHTIRPRCEAAEKKEHEFWAKVEEIKKVL